MARLTAARALGVIAIIGIAAITGPRPVVAQGGFGFPGGNGGDVELVKQFDKNGDKRLDAAERKAARAAVGGGMRRGRGFFMSGGGGAVPTAGRALTPADVQKYPESTSLYDPAALRTIFLQFDSPDWEGELADFHGTDVEVPATMIVDGKTYRDVGVHFRGASSFMMTPDGYKRSLNLSIDDVHKEQQLGGYRTLNLLNAANDPTFLRTVLYTDIARQYIAAPRMNYVRVVINGESWGIYLNAQQFNKDFTREHFGSDEGARWKVPGSPRGNGGLEFLGDSADLYNDL